MSAETRGEIPQMQICQLLIYDAVRAYIDLRNSDKNSSLPSALRWGFLGISWCKILLKKLFTWRNC